MDSLTHGLLGLSLGALRRPDADRSAVLVACVVAAELPDLDYLWPAADSVLHTLKAHRGLSHSLVAAPLVALTAAGAAKLVFRKARPVPLFVWALGAVLFAHLLADAWTGWGTRLLLPFSDARVTLDWMMVLDPFFTVPLLIGALWDVRKRQLDRRAMLVGLSVACAYLGTRVVARSMIHDRVAERHSDALQIQVFPSWLDVTEWRYVAVFPERYVAGRAGVFDGPQPQATHERSTATALSAVARENGTVREVLAWARFPLIELTQTARGATRVNVADLRYHLNGAPTLCFDIELDATGRVTSARLDRGSARDLLRRFRGQ